MGLMHSIGKAMIKSAQAAAPEQAGNRTQSPATTLDKVMKFRPVILIVLVLSLIGSIAFSNMASQHKAVWGETRDSVICQYGDAETQNADYVRMDVVYAEAVGWFYKTYSSQLQSSTDLYDIYIVKDEEGRSALYCDHSKDTMSIKFIDNPTTESSFLFLKNSFPMAVTGFITNIKKQFGDYNNYSKLVTAEMEEMDLIFGATPAEKQKGYIQSEEDKQQEQQWRMVSTICEYVFAACILLLIILTVLRKRQLKRAMEAELERQRQKEMY